MTLHQITRIYPAVRDDIADLVTYRALPTQHIDMVDPFLFLNHHGPQVYPPGNRGLPFGPHPHRGFETVTFIFDGDIAHRDSGGHESVIGPWGVQWMTAGRGLVHEEVSSAEFKVRGGPMEILQLWVNLPARLKMTEPAYVGLQGDQIPVIEEDAGRVRIHLTSGEWGEKAGPIRSLTDVAVMSIEMDRDGRLAVPVPAGRSIFFYVVRGDVAVGGGEVPVRHLAEFTQEGDGLEIQALQPSLALLCHAQPLREPVVSHGPFVMNTREEIHQAIRDYQAGLFG
ncbi:hypothetical protein SAMN06265795_11480 [Noviherbaspirillum humi]|uniref:Redox-sensitive bicupin YhaK, pirin superfamily n=1 Tax=Noviherbaspirillum humi TaxID=1688639 RepID=A0A239K3H2_9BURK|nr:pirin family protein [Noviherbaspirillum humi]SNT11704.1 hypothetical protein SAMN06265795_11480 [Noviherbaspirillum humi]